MKKYNKPNIEEEQIELEDVIASSGGISFKGIANIEDGDTGDSEPVGNLW